MANLLNNAAKYTPVDGTLSLSLSVDEDVQVRILDNGIGIDPDLLPHVFDLFTQGDRTPDRSQGGLGLGLALVKSLVELHGGCVVVESEGPGQGSQFTVKLPRLQVSTASTGSAAAHTKQISTASLRILVVDDNKDAADTLGLLLVDHGHDVWVAHGAEQALEAMTKGVRDIGLPGMDGHELARLLRAHPNGCAGKYIALTGYGALEDKLRGEEAGFAHYIVKPADVEELVRLLQPGKTCSLPF
jgi:CheY-like chemotaxis protein/anti-sigma regulatory factor (Ser/Thr protein kinase)